jgi:hypothetical protein
LRFSIAIIRSNFKKTRQISLCMVQCWLSITKKLHEKIKSAKIIWYLRFLIAIIRSKL